LVPTRKAPIYHLGDRRDDLVDQAAAALAVDRQHRPGSPARRFRASSVIHDLFRCLVHRARSFDATRGNCTGYATCTVGRFAVCVYVPLLCCCLLLHHDFANW
jgi:hypothetical protein